MSLLFLMLDSEKYVLDALSLLAAFASDGSKKKRNMEFPFLRAFWLQ